MESPITIVDRGRGPQLSTSRITVQDILPFYRAGASNDEIREAMPSLSDAEIASLKGYIRDHWEEVLRAEVQIKAFHDRRRAAQPDWTRKGAGISAEVRHAKLKERLEQAKSERNGAHHPAG